MLNSSSSSPASNIQLLARLGHQEAPKPRLQAIVWYANNCFCQIDFGEVARECSIVSKGAA